MAEKNFQELPYTSPPEQRTWSTEVPSRTSTASQIGHGIRAAAAVAAAASPQGGPDRRAATVRRRGRWSRRKGHLKRKSKSDNQGEHQMAVAIFCW